MIGQTISHYRILEKLGEGGMGVVYKAEDTKLGRFVALKFLSHSMSDDKAKKRFVHEAQAASSLEHPNICSIHEIDETPDGQIFIVMPCYEGESLQARIERGPLNLDEAVDIAIQAASGLAKAHEKGIVHRDIKPGNIFITKDGLVKIVDFGLAKLSGRTKLTRTGTSPGTVSYMSPEQLKGGDVDHRSDIWALGVVLYEMITGETPFRGEYEQAMSYSIMNESPKPLRTLRPDVPLEMERLIEKTLSKDPNGRYQKATELVAALQWLKKRIESSPVGTGCCDAKSVPSIAVLPFVNMSADPENEYFSDGLAEDLINALTKIRNLRVAARTSAFSFKGEKLDVRDIGRKLGVETVMEGSVRKAGDRLRITAQLISVADGYHLWSEQYDRTMRDIFAIQDEITRAIVQNLKMQRLNEEQGTLITPYTDNLEAYSLYLKGRYFWNRRTVDAIESSITYFQQAVQKDPDYALAHVGLADAYIVLAYSSYGAMNPRQAYPTAKEAVLKALKIDETLSEAHASLAMIRCSYDWDWAEAEREFKQAIALNPSYAWAHHWYAIFLAQMGRHAEAEREIGTARQLDPFSLIINAVAGLLLFFKGEYDRAISDLEETLKLEPNFWHAHLYLGYAYWAKGLYEKAIESVERATVLSGHAAYPASMLGSFCGLTGDVARARELLHRLEERAKNAYVPPFYFSNIYVGLGDLDATFACVERGLEDHDPALLFFSMWPLFSDEVRSDPRFVEMLKRIGFET